MQAAKREIIPPQFNNNVVQANRRSVFVSRVFTCILSGCVAGILGLNGYQGFLLYLFSSLLIGFVWFLRVKQTQTYFLQTRTLFQEGFMPGLYSFVLLWTLLYAVIYVY
mmetsp:Transcript_380/g.480  ORF Transcript_380/g.480 Transcript_380/m.480 type:complete len:109 (+) Transcript_380:86-412(+)